MVWEVDRDRSGASKIELTLGEMIVLLNRVGITLHEARHTRPPIEVEALLLSQIAQREAQREAEGIHIATNTPIIENRPGEAAPGWVADLPEE